MFVKIREENITMLTFLIVCPAVFLAGLIDAIGGGGGLISLPIYLLAGLPPHRAIATNKLSSSMGTAAATVRFAKMGHINFNIALSCSVTAILGSFLGASLSVYTNERIIQIFILVLLPILFVYLLFTKKDFDWAVDTASKKKKMDCSSAEFLSIEEGLCVQIMHIGSFDNEPETVAIMDKYLGENGYVNDFTDERHHHEIYLSDPRKVAPERCKTVIRHPIKKL